MQSSRLRVPQKDLPPAWEFVQSVCREISRDDKSHQHTIFFIITQRQQRAAVLASWDAAIGSDGERVQRKGNSASSIFQPRQTAEEAVGTWEGVMVTIISPTTPPPLSPMSLCLQDSLPPAPGPQYAIPAAERDAFAPKSMCLQLNLAPVQFSVPQREK